jgi:hypothetical protein
MSPTPDRDQAEGGSGTLDMLYEQLGQAHALGDQLDEQHRQALAQIDAEEKRLNAEREESEASGDTDRMRAIDDDLDRLRQAYLTIKDQLGEDEQQDVQQQRGERDGDGDDEHADAGAPGPRDADRGDG